MRRAHGVSKFGWAPPVVIAIAFVAMLAWTWGGWPDPIVDFGRELYVPWQLSEGKVLYRDLAYFNGPLSPYVNSILFRVLGVSLRTLVLANIAIAAGVVVMIWKLLRLAGDRISATVACLLFITLFMTTQYVAIGNYNWITPYSHELTHGIALSLLTMLRFVRHIRRPTPARASGVGLLVGLIFLTKPEVFVAIAPAIAIAMLVARGGRSLQAWIAFAIGSSAPVLISSALLGWRGTLGGWIYAFDARITSLPFYRTSMGMDRPGLNLALGAMQGGASVLMFMLFASLDRALIARRVSRPAHWAAAIIAMLMIVLGLSWSRNKIGWHDAFRGLPIVLGLWGIAMSLGLRRRRGRLSSRLVLQMSLVSFAILLTLKLIFVVRLYHYGFALTMPAMLVASAVFLSWLPRTLQIRPAIVTRCCMVGVLGFIAVRYLSAYATFYSRKPATVAAGTADEFRADITGQLVNEIVDVLKPLPPQTSVAVVPQGAMVNYLAGKANPTPYFTLMPPEVLMFGDDNIAAAYQKAPPDVLVIIAADLGEYGYRSFDEIAPRTSAFFKLNYQPIRTISPSRDLPPVTILRHVPHPTTSPTQP